FASSSLLAHLDLHSFPTRRSSDLRRRRAARLRSQLHSTLPIGGHESTATHPTARPRAPSGSRSTRPCVRASDRPADGAPSAHSRDRKSTRLNSSHLVISYAVFCLK